MKPNQYLAIKLWGVHMRSYDFYIKTQQAIAADANAPIDALYERDNKWVCVSDLAEGHPFRADYERLLDERMQSNKDANETVKAQDAIRAKAAKHWGVKE